mgnify:FL=1
MIDEKVLEEYYGEIANKLDEMIPVEWTKIAMLAEDLGTSCAAGVYFFTKDNKVYYNHNIPEDFNVDEEVYRKILDELLEINGRLREEFINFGIQPWKLLSFILNEDWSFKLNYEYEIDEDIDYMERKIIWAYEELGIMPEGEFGKSILKEYLEEKEK